MDLAVHYHEVKPSSQGHPYTASLYTRRPSYTLEEEAQRLGVPTDRTHGIALSAMNRNDYQMTLSINPELPPLISREVYARNSAVNPGYGVTAASHLHADRVWMMRKVEDETGESDFYTGRVKTEGQAKELITFLFLSELESHKKGITEISPSEYRFQFAVQSLLSTARISDMRHPFSPNEPTKIKQEAAIYASLANTILEINDPQNPDRIIKVHISPIPLAETQCNFMNKLEAVLPDEISGRDIAREMSEKADAGLKDHFNRSPRAAHAPLIDHTFSLLEEERNSSGHTASWKEILCRAYICHLLGIPIVVHCKSNTDRTSLVGAMITAMRKWIKLGKPVPDGDIRKIAEDPLFKELFAASLLKSLHNTDLARGKRGYKDNTTVMGMDLGFTNPALFDLLPKRYLIKTNEVWRRTKIIILQFFMAILVVGLSPLSLAAIGIRAIYKNKTSSFYAFLALFVTPYKIMIHADKLFSQYAIDHKHPWVKENKLFA